MQSEVKNRRAIAKRWRGGKVKVGSKARVFFSRHVRLFALSSALGDFVEVGFSFKFPVDDVD